MLPSAQRPLVSIVTPSLNKARFLRATIESVLSQDYPRVEYLVMDGGSTDGSLEILAGYGDRIRYIAEPDAGQADAVNRGFQFTSGEIFAFLNADDTYQPGAISAAVRGFADHPGAGMIYGEADYMDANGGTLGRYPTRDFESGSLGGECFICQPAAFLRREVFEQAGMLDCTYHCALDYELWMRVSRVAKIRRIPGCLACSRVYRETKTIAQRGIALREAMRAQRRHFAYVPHRSIHTYTRYLVDGRDQFFEHAPPTVRSYALSLAVGLWENRSQPLRYLKEWGALEGLRGVFSGRWDDGFISRQYLEARFIPEDQPMLRIQGFAPRKRMRLEVRLDGEEVAEAELPPGRFELALECPEAFRGRECELMLLASPVTRSLRDYRAVSLRLDAIEASKAGV
ncbi:MAG: glycosyltransferase [Bryobacteraceae bacterium]|nr:glycosyltransferase [Bryobacteraceae bacterium]